MSGSERIAKALGLSGEQQQALGLSADTVIAAGAGAGKTTTLVGALVYDLLESEVEPQRICVCTFTRAAAANLIARSGAALAEIAGASAPDVESMWIGTIDSLCARLLREHALEAGVSPRFRVAEDRELAPMRYRALDHALQQLDADALRELDRLVDPDGDEIAAEVKRAHERLREHGRSGPALWMPSVPAKQELLDVLDELLAHPDMTAFNVISALERERQAVLDDNLARLTTAKWGINRKALNELRDQAIELRDAYRQGLVDLQTEPVRAAFGELLDNFATSYAELKHRAETLDFRDLSERALDLAGSGVFEGFLRTYIDEAQDTSPLQLELLRRLSSGPVVSVGDASQSIYSFRGADVENFRAAAAGQSRIELADNYRSRPEVLGAINELCRPLPELAPDLIIMRSAGPKSELEPLGRQSAAVEVLTLIKEGRSQPSAAEEAAAAAPEILAAAQRRKIGLGDVCVLVRDNTEVGVYADAFRALGVPALAIQGRGLLSQPECLDVTHYLRLLANPHDEEALVRVLSSPFCSLSDERLEEICSLRRRDLERLEVERDGERLDHDDPDYPRLLDYVAREEPEFFSILADVHNRRGHGSVAVLLQRAVEAHRYDLALQLIDTTGSRWRNVEKLLWLIADLEREFDGPNPRALAERLEAEREAREDEGQDARLPEEIEAVRVMTIHQAKGDEFKLVAAARLSRRPFFDRSRLHIDAGGRLGLSLPPAGEHTEPLRDSVSKAHLEAEKEREQEEAWRLLYVALTRAEEHLMLIASTNDSKSKGVSWKDPFATLLAGHDLPRDPARVQWIDLPNGARIRSRALAEVKPKSSRRRLPKLTPSEPPIAGELAVREPQMPPIAPGALSYTALASWRRCSMRRMLEHDLALTDLRPLPGDEGPASVSGGGGQRRFGIALHHALAQMPWRGDMLAAIDPLLREAGLQGDDAERGFALLAKLSKSGLAGRIGSATEIWSERPFHLALGGQLFSGQIDLIAAEPELALVVDWKSGDDTDGVFGEDYRLQRLLYTVSALSQPAPPAAVETISYDLGAGESTGERHELSELGELRSELEATVVEILTMPAVPAASDRQPFCEGCPGLSRICPVSRS